MCIRRTTFGKYGQPNTLAFVSCVADRRLLGVMIQCVHGVLIAASLVLNLGAAFAQPQHHASAKAVMPGCRNFIKDGGWPTSQPAMLLSRPAKLQMSVCLDKVLRLEYAHPSICSPRHWTIGQLIGVVVHYIDSRPARLHEDFTKLAIEALQATWPCARAG
jgi:hypothetical protein